MTPNDFDALCGILKDPEVMYAYEGAFDDDMGARGSKIR